MKALILAAGKGERLRPLTETIPKVMLPVAGKPILQHNLESLEGMVDSAVIVIGYKGDAIRSHFGGSFGKIKLVYVEQKEQLGTGHALLQAKGELNGKFVMMMGDDLYSKKDIKECAKSDLAILTMRGDTRNFGACIAEKGALKGIVEKSEKPVSDLINAGLYVLDERIFKEKMEKSSRGEYEVTDAIKSLASKAEIKCVKGTFWEPVAYLWKLLEANEAIVEKMGTQIHPEANISKDARIEGPVVIGKGATLKNCVVRAHSVIGENAVIGNFVEIKNSIIMEGTKIPHLSYVGDSVIGRNCNFGAGTKVANLRFDDGNVKVMVQGKSVDSGRRKLGCFIADDVKTGVNTLLMPGAAVKPGAFLEPGKVFK
jgi:bifunctional UDP-N-acetylglucosamine pyrophosphorylase/glucosamine-1-phosphate N-acetyltransferase